MNKHDLTVPDLQFMAAGKKVYTGSIDAGDEVAWTRSTVGTWVMDAPGAAEINSMTLVTMYGPVRTERQMNAAQTEPADHTTPTGESMHGLTIMTTDGNIPIRAGATQVSHIINQMTDVDDCEECTFNGWVRIDTTTGTKYVNRRKVVALEIHRG